jgi:hypothetical protein
VRELAVQSALNVALDLSETPLFEGPSARARTALEIIAIEVHETGLQPRLWRGECRKSECDGGLATGELQLHLGRGLELVGDRWVRPCLQGSPERCWTSEAVLEDHEAAARIALHILRGGGLTGYTGQGRDGPAPRWIRGVMASAGAPPLDQ